MPGISWITNNTGCGLAIEELTDTECY